MSSTKHPERIKAEIEYKEALHDLKLSESISEVAYETCSKMLDLARKKLVEMEIKHPTQKEYRDQGSVIFKRNIGLLN